ncbi:winged helix-turn-helix transcriptional regulator [Luteimonas abyssi]|uniref:winged helix-turn-helix transcriptional regulator n=1 Tax=Luteimonas abyssi TaxID=1247514 RepID=UPI0009EAAD4C
MRAAIAVIDGLSDGHRRWGELQRSIGNVSKKVLTVTLRHPERDGFVGRTLTPAAHPCRLRTDRARS